MNINNFDYTNEPYLKMKKFKIHVLTDDGFNKYLDKDSYIHKYLKSLSPRRIKEIFDNDDHKSEQINRNMDSRNYNKASTPEENLVDLKLSKKEEDKNLGNTG